MRETKDYYEVDIKQVIYGLWHRLWAIVLAGVLGGGILFSYAALLVAPKYQAEAMLYVNNSSFSVGSTSFSFSNAELSAAQSLVDTYIVILNSWPVLDEVIQEAELNYSYDELRDMLSAAPVNSTEVFSVIVTSTDPQEAERIANTIVDILPDKISDIVDGSSVRIVAHALIPSEKVSPNITMYTAMGMLAGIVVACLIVIVRLVNDTHIHNEDYLTNTYNLPVLAVVPNLFSRSEDNYKTSYTPEHRKAEVRR